MKGVAWVGEKGGCGKTVLAHALALGAAWHNVPAYLMHTDNRDPIAVSGRPYMYYDAREPETLQRLITAAINQDGFCIIDSGGNRPDFDQWIAQYMDLVLVPVGPDDEDVKLGLKTMDRLEHAGSNNVRFVVNKYPAGKNERLFVAKYLAKLPQEKIMGGLSEVKAIRRLKEDDDPQFQTPPSKVNNLSRHLYRQVRDALESKDLRSDEMLMIA